MLELRVVAVKDEGLPGGRLRESEQEPQGCGLPGAVWPEKARDRSPGKRKREPLHGQHLPVAFGQPANADGPARRVACRRGLPLLSVDRRAAVIR